MSGVLTIISTLNFIPYDDGSKQLVKISDWFVNEPAT